MHETSIGATIFETWLYHFYKSLLLEFIKHEDLRLAIVSNYPFADYFQRLILILYEDPENEK
jgi:hypothetical protein